MATIKRRLRTLEKARDWRNKPAGLTPDWIAALLAAPKGESWQRPDGTIVEEGELRRARTATAADT